MTALPEIQQHAEPAVAAHAVESVNGRFDDQGRIDWTSVLQDDGSTDWTDYDQAKRCDVEAYAGFARGLLDRGVYPPASQFEAWFPSLAHTDEHVEQTIDAAKAALSEL